MGKYVFKLPDLGEGTVESEVVEWHVQTGDTVAEDQHIADVMTDKATVEISSPVAGTVAELGCEAGQVLAVGAPLITFDIDGGGNAPSLQPEPKAAAKPTETVADAPAQNTTATSPEAPVAGGNYVFKLPDLGEGTVESEIAEWHVQPGDTVAEDQHIADVMTDKATVEISSPVAGTVVSLGGKAGAVIAVGSPLITFQVEGAGNASAVPSATAAKPTPSRGVLSESESQRAPAVKPAVQAIAVGIGSGKALASPAVRKRALEAEIDLANVPGSGPAGRIRHEDLDTFIASGGRLAGVAARTKRTGIEEIPVRGLRRMIAEKMQQSKRQIPHFTYVEEVDVTELEALRQHLNTHRQPGQPKLTVLPFIMQALVKALREFPQFNATFDDQNNVITRYEAVHLGIAAQTDTGLKVPVVKHAEAMDVWECATEMLRVSQAAKENTATKEELTGASITITSLGPLGGVAHTPVINYPEVAIIGTNKMIERPVVQNGQIVVRKMMNLSSSFDHRVVDGYDAAQMIQRVKSLLEHPATIFM